MGNRFHQTINAYFVVDSASLADNGDCVDVHTALDVEPLGLLIKTVTLCNIVTAQGKWAKN